MTLILKFIEKDKEMNWKDRSGDVISDRGNKVKERKSSSKSDIDIPFFSFYKDQCTF